MFNFALSATETVVLALAATAVLAAEAQERPAPTAYRLMRQLEAPLPKDFPPPGPPDRVTIKEYPAARVARAGSKEGGGMNMSFWKLFLHIKRHEIPMSSPVEFTLGEDGLRALGRGEMTRGEQMGFFYVNPEVGKLGRDGAAANGVDMGVDVVDVPKAVFLSIGIEGDLNGEKLKGAAEKIEAFLAQHGTGFARGDSYRFLSYHSPFVPVEQRYHELQLEVTAKPSPEHTPNAIAPTFASPPSP
jgi:hypothetical protein